MSNYMLSADKRFPLQKMALDHAHELLANKSGFILHVETVGGQIYSGPTASSEVIELHDEGILTIAQGDDFVFIRDIAITAIRVQEC